MGKTDWMDDALEPPRSVFLSVKDLLRLDLIWDFASGFIYLEQDTRDERGNSEGMDREEDQGMERWKGHPSCPSVVVVHF